MQFTNNKGCVYGIGDIAYYISITLNGYFMVRQIVLKSFTVYGQKNKIKCVVTTKHGKVNINDLYKTREECKEMIRKWEKENLPSILMREMKSSIVKNNL